MQTAENIKIGNLAPHSLRGEHSTLLKPIGYLMKHELGLTIFQSRNEENVNNHLPASTEHENHKVECVISQEKKMSSLNPRG